jgi:pSer/pThr/pTyr-binding forkhead associated (FHA) protein
LVIGLFEIWLVSGGWFGLIEYLCHLVGVLVRVLLIAGKQFILYRNPTYIGSSPDNQIYLFKDPQVGRRHAAIRIVPGGYELEDLPLGVPTLVNGHAVARHRLRTGDQLQVGATRFLFQEKTRAEESSR